MRKNDSFIDDICLDTNYNFMPILMQDHAYLSSVYVIADVIQF